MAGDPRSVEIEKAIRIAAPREDVYALWSRCDQFPHFMSLVEEVRQLDDDRWHWVVKGPAGKRVEWDATITERRAPERLAWRSDPDSPVQHAGCVRFDDVGSGTRVTVRMSYSPPAGVIGHTIAALFGRDAKRELDADLMRMKAYVETGRPPHDAAAGRRIVRARRPRRRRCARLGNPVRACRRATPVRRDCRPACGVRELEDRAVAVDAHRRRAALAQLGRDLAAGGPGAALEDAGQRQRLRGEAELGAHERRQLVDQGRPSAPAIRPPTGPAGAAAAPGGPARAARSRPRRAAGPPLRYSGSAVSASSSITCTPAHWNGSISE
jgi:uncharacterized membrane protein